MIVVVSVTDAGDVTVQLDSDEADDETAALAGHVVDDMLSQARATAVATWLDIHSNSSEAGE